MAYSGRTLISTVLLAVAVVLFVPVFADAAAGWAPGGWAYGPYVGVVLDNLPTILIAAAALILIKPTSRGGA